MPESVRYDGFPKHFEGNRYFNPGAPQAPGFLDLLRWKLSTRPAPSPSFVNDVQQSVPPTAVEGAGLLVTLVNHSTVLLQQRGLNVLTDPVWSERVSPLSWAGPRRKRVPGVAWNDLPRIDLVLISHNHYDHLDVATVRRLAARGESTFIVPRGVARWFRVKNIGPVHELDWGESFAKNGYIAHSVPALHFSSRGLFDRNQTLWCGYMIEAGARRIYFAGDTGFGPHFAQIRGVFGSPDLAFLPIGAYEPRWFMSPVHMAPGEAVQAHRILSPRLSVAIHHGTFQLADESLEAPEQRLRECADVESFRILRNGESLETP